MQLLGTRLQTLFICVSALFFLCSPTTGFAQNAFPGQWYQVGPDWHLPEKPVNAVDAPALTGGHFVFQSVFEVTDGDRTIVIDFKNSSVLGRFHHTLTDTEDKIVREAHGGIESESNNPFFLRHGREFRLPPGQYTLTTKVHSPYFIAQPQPYWDTLANYREAIKWGNVITLVSLGVLISLAVYYSILALVRRRTTEIMYAIFIWMNIVYNGTALLVTPSLLGIHWFYFVGGPILLSNFAYILFARHLLQIRAETHPRLDKLAKLAMATLGALLLIALFNTNWIIESARYGVALMMLYGLIAAIVRAYERYEIAYYYLVAIAAFFIIGSIAISSRDLEGIYTIYIEHFGLLAVTVEVLLLGLVLGYQFAEVYREKEHNLALVRHSLQIAHHDALTGLPNRYAWDLALKKIPDSGMITFLDMDNLKLYNDTCGHHKGDEMLQVFSSKLSSKLEQTGTLYRLGGDEFAVVCAHRSDADTIHQAIDDTIRYMRKNGFEKADVSYGSAHVKESSSLESLRILADKRMYAHKSRHSKPQ